MNILRCLPLLTSAVLLAARLHAADAPKLDPHLESLRPFLGKTWKGHFKNSTPEKPVVDVSHWERALNGQAVRILHSVNEGSYGGESIVRWDAARKSIVYHYFTTAGFMTTGTLEVKEGRIHTHETVAGNAGGVTAVRSTQEIRPDGTFLVKTEYQKDGNWGPGREVVYREDPQARVIFK